jgi:hypothetical protein
MAKNTYTLESTKALLDLGQAVMKAAAKLEARQKGSKAKGGKLATAVIPLCVSPEDSSFCAKPWPPGPTGPFGIEISIVPLPPSGKGVKPPRPGRPRK